MLSKKIIILSICLLFSLSACYDSSGGRVKEITISDDLCFISIRPDRARATLFSRTRDIEMPVEVCAKVLIAKQTAEKKTTSKVDIVYTLNIFTRTEVK